MMGLQQGKTVAGQGLGHSLVARCQLPHWAARGPGHNWQPTGRSSTSGPKLQFRHVKQGAHLGWQPHLKQASQDRSQSGHLPWQEGWQLQDWQAGQDMSQPGMQLQVLQGVQILQHSRHLGWHEQFMQASQLQLQSGMHEHLHKPQHFSQTGQQGAHNLQEMQSP